LPRFFYHRIQEDVGWMQVERDAPASQQQSAWMPLAQRYIDPRGLPTGVGYIERERAKMMRWAGASPNAPILAKYGDKKIFKQHKAKRR